MKAVIGIIAGVIAFAAAAGVGLYAYGKEPSKTDTVSIGEFSELNVDATSADIIIKQGRENQISYRLPESLVPEIHEENGKLRIVSRSDRLFNFSFTTGKTYIEITMTADALEKAQIQVTSGDIEVKDIGIAGSFDTTSGDIEVTGSSLGKDLQIHATSGDLSIRDSVFGKLESTQTSGDLSMKNVQCSSFSANATSGDFDVDRLDAKNLEIRTTAGDVDCRLTGAERDYRFDIDCTAGDIRVGGSDHGNKYHSGESADRSCKIETTAGDVKVSFAE